MNQTTCDDIRDMLVDYSDGVLSVEDRAQVEGHLATCETCRVELQALERSLELAQYIWQDQETGLTEIEPLNLGRKSRRLELRWTALAASILIALGGILIWQANSPPQRRAIPPPTIPEPTPAEIERAVNRAAGSAILLATADLLSQQPGGESYAQERYSYIENKFSDTEAGLKANRKLMVISERSLKP